MKKILKHVTIEGFGNLLSSQPNIEIGKIVPLI